MAERLRKLTNSWPFQAAILLLIIVAAAVVGLETYPGIQASHGRMLYKLDRALIWIFAVEILLRILAYGSRPQDFFRDGWNVLDFLVVGLSLLPFIPESLVTFRLLRLLRLPHMVKMFPEMRLMVETILRTIPTIGYLAVLFGLLIYVYAVIGTSAFGANDPLHFGRLHLTILTLFQVITLEGWVDLLTINSYGCAAHGYEGREFLCTQSEGHPIAATAYFVSFVMLGTFLMLNVMIGFVVDNLQTTKARQQEEARQSSGEPTLGAEQRIGKIRENLDALEKEILKQD